MNSNDHEAFAIRPATAADLETVLAHRRLMFLDMGYADDAPLRDMMDRSRTFFAERMANGSYRGWLIETAGGEIVAGGGIMILDFHTVPSEDTMKRPIIINVYTRPEYRRRGCARRLMETMVEWCRESGFAQVRLHASQDGRPLYEAMGFKSTTEMMLNLR